MKSKSDVPPDETLGEKPAGLGIFDFSFTDFRGEFFLELVIGNVTDVSFMGETS